MRLIDADVLKKSIYNDVPLKYFSGRDTGRALRNMEFILSAIDVMPTVDTVKHSRWAFREDTGYHYECCNCKYLEQYNVHYCPMCGAKMD